MGMTIAEKILARASGRERVQPDQTVVARVDLAMSHENTDLVRKSFLEIGAERVWDPSKIVIVFDHRVTAESEETATTHRAVRAFVAEQAITNFYDVARGGVCHQVLPENGHVRPGMLLVGTDSHTTTHGALGAFATGIASAEMAGVWAEGTLRFKAPSTIRILVEGEFRPWISANDLILRIIGMLGTAGADCRAVEFDGSAIRRMPVASRMVLANLATDMGANVAFTPVDDVLLDYLRACGAQPLDAIAPDADAVYERVIELDAEQDLWEPQVACPNSVDYVKPLSAAGEVAVDQAVLGSCTNGRLEDLAMAAAILAGRSIHLRTRLLVIPASQQIYRDAMRLGYLKTLVAAGAMINPPGCGLCMGVEEGILAPGETCVSSTNRNFLGSIGREHSAVYLASPAVVAASAVAGKLAHPGSMMDEVPFPTEI